MKGKKETPPAGPDPGTWFKKWKNRGWLPFLYAIFGIAFYLLLIGHVITEHVQIRAGQVSPVTVVSPVTRVDDQATQEARDQAAKAVKPVYARDHRLTEGRIEQLDRFFSRLRPLLSASGMAPDEKKQKIRQLLEETYSGEFSDRSLERIGRLTPEELTSVRLKTREIVTRILDEGVRAETLGEKQNEVDHLLVATLWDDTLSENARYVVRELSRRGIVVNEAYDSERTEKLREAARDSVPPIYIYKGQTIVSKGEVVTEDQYRRLVRLGLAEGGKDWQPRIGLGLLTVGLCLLLHVSISRFSPRLRNDPSGLAMFFSVCLLALAGMKAVALGQNLEWNRIGYLAPTGLGTMLTVLLLGVELAPVTAVLLAVCAGFMFREDPSLFFDIRFAWTALAGGVAGAFALAGVRRRSALLKAGMVASLAAMGSATAFTLLIPGGGGLREWGEALLFSGGSGILSAAFTLGFLPYFEAVFGILSPLRLVELGNPNHPLLRKLLTEAPGTYHHSILVANLAESAAEAIGADGLLARIGAYYHDVGKIRRPRFFIENQMGRSNPHDKLSPHLSRTIILSHPADGVEILEQYRIPKPIRDIAAQHHGTTLLKYFYHKALKQKCGSQVREADFRYPGPKAQFKEAAIVGICDSAEAAVRALARPTPERIEALVKKIIQERLEDGQFDECDLTLKELDAIARIVTETLVGMFHTRLEYPEEATVKGVKQA